MRIHALTKTSARVLFLLALLSLASCKSFVPEECGKELKPIYALVDKGYCATGNITFTKEKQEATAKADIGEQVTFVCVVPGFAAIMNDQKSLAEGFYRTAGADALAYKQSRCK